MPVEFKDYYALLGVARTATDAEIKQAFRARARQYHPDVAKDKATAEEKFKEINEANEVLSDPDKRRKYDELGADWKRPDRPPPPPGRRPGGGPPPDPEFHFGGTGFSDFFTQFFGSRQQAAAGFGQDSDGGPRGAARAQPGADIEGDILVTLAEVLHGATRTLTLQRTDPRTGHSSSQTLRVRIPPGVQDGQLIRLAGKGQEGHGGGEAGHLYLRVKLATHPDFSVRGTDLYANIDLAPWEAVLGATVRRALLTGAVDVKIPAGTQAGRQFRLRGQGLPTGEGTRGDLYARVVIQVPATLTAEERVRWEHLAKDATYNPRTSP